MLLPAEWALAGTVVIPVPLPLPLPLPSATGRMTGGVHFPAGLWLILMPPPRLTMTATMMLLLRLRLPLPPVPSPTSAPAMQRVQPPVSAVSRQYPFPSLLPPRSSRPRSPGKARTPPLAHERCLRRHRHLQRPRSRSLPLPAFAAAAWLRPRLRRSQGSPRQKASGISRNSARIYGWSGSCRGCGCGAPREARSRGPAEGAPAAGGFGESGDPGTAGGGSPTRSAVGARGGSLPPALRLIDVVDVVDVVVVVFDVMT